MRKVLCTIAAGMHRPLLDVAGPTLERYAARHGYELVALEHNPTPQRPASWGKVALAYDLAYDYDVVFWVDSDAVIVDDSKDVVHDMSRRRSFNVVVHDAPEGRIPNLGVFAARGDWSTRRLLRAMWARREYTHHRWWENAAFLDLLGFRTGDRVGSGVPTPWRFVVGSLDKGWNSIPADPSPAPRIVHFPGMTLDERIVAMRLASGS